MRSTLPRSFVQLAGTHLFVCMCKLQDAETWSLDQQGPCALAFEGSPDLQEAPHSHERPTHFIHDDNLRTWRKLNRSYDIGANKKGQLYWFCLAHRAICRSYRPLKVPHEVIQIPTVLG